MLPRQMEARIREMALQRTCSGLASTPGMDSGSSGLQGLFALRHQIPAQLVTCQGKKEQAPGL